MFSPDVICQKTSLFCQWASRTLLAKSIGEAQPVSLAGSAAEEWREWRYYGILRPQGKSNRWRCACAYHAVLCRFFEGKT